MKQDLNGVRTPEDVVRRYDLGDIPLIVKSQKEISLEVSKKVNSNEVISAINLTPEQAKITAEKIALEGYTTINDGFSVDTQGNMMCNNATMNNAKIEGGELEMTHPNGSKVNIGAFEGIVIEDNSLPDYQPYAQYTSGGIAFHDDDSNFVKGYYGSNYLNFTDDNYVDDTVFIDGETGNIEITGTLKSSNGVCQGSREEIKKDFEKLDNALNIVNNVDIYKYHLTYEKETDKKHIGFIIGKNYKYSEEITSKKNDSADLYSMISVLWKAVQEQQAEIEKLKEVKK